MLLPDVAAHLLDLTQNALDAGADKITICLHVTDDYTVLRLRDNGCGMNSTERKNALRRGYSTKPYSCGMGLPLARDHAETFALRSRKGRGAALSARFLHRVVLPGDLYGTITLLQRVNPTVHFYVSVWEERTIINKI